MAVYKLRWCVRGYHVFQEDWDADFGDELECLREAGNTKDPMQILEISTECFAEVLDSSANAVGTSIGRYLRLLRRYRKIRSPSSEFPHASPHFFAISLFTSARTP